MINYARSVVAASFILFAQVAFGANATHVTLTSTTDVGHLIDDAVLRKVNCTVQVGGQTYTGVIVESNNRLITMKIAIDRFQRRIVYVRRELIEAFAVDVPNEG